MAKHSDIEQELVDCLPQLRAFARTFHRDSQRADDLVQEAVLKAWSKIASFEKGTNLRAWLFTILRNTFLSEMRKKTREVEDADGKFAAQLVQKPAQEGALEMADFRAALAKLPEEQREALILVGASGFSYDEAAEICDCAAGTVKSRVNRARRRLATLLHLDDASQVGSNPLIVAAGYLSDGRTRLAA